MSLCSDGSPVRRSGLLAVVALTTCATLQAQRGFVRVPNDGLIVGQVVDADRGTPISGAVVAIVGSVIVQRDRYSFSLGGTETPAWGNMTGTALVTRVLTGPDGYFVFRDLPHAEFGIRATKPGYAEGAYGRRRPGGPSQHLSLSGADARREIVLRVWKHGAISGVVTDEAGEPLVGIAIQSFRLTETNGVRAHVPSTGATTDDRGVYRLANLLPGEYIVAASSPQVAVPLALSRDARDARMMPVSGGGPGAVPMPGSATAVQLGDSVYGLPPNGATPPQPESDRLSIYPTTFHPAGGSPLETVPVTLRSGEDREGIDLHLRPVRTVRVSGTLNGPADTLAMRRVRLVPVDNDVLENSAPVTTTDARGAFVFPAVPTGRYSLRATTRGLDGRGEPERALHWADVDLAVGQDDVDGVTVTLRPGLIISGSLRFDGSSPRPTGARLLQTRIVVERANRSLPGSETSATAVVDDTGEFSTTGLPAGSYFVRVADSPVGWMFKGAMLNGRDLSENAIDVGDDLAGIAIEFTDRWTGLRGVVTTPAGQIDAAALVLLFPTDSSRWRTYTPAARRMRSARVTAHGEFSFASVPIGEYYVTAIGDENGADWQDPRLLDALSRSAHRVTINDGDQKTLTLRRKDARQ
jgi:hypothetical protein